MTRREDSFTKTSQKNRVDTDLSKGLVSGLSPEASRSGNVLSGGDKASREGTKIFEDTWAEMIIVAKHLYAHNPCKHREPCPTCFVLEGRNGEEAEIADIFEWMRIHMFGGEKYSESVLKRANREVETECGPWT